MSASATFATDLLGLILNATPVSGMALNASVSPATTLYVTLHTSDPGTSNNQTANESTDAHRVAILRNAVTPKWGISGGVATPVAQIVFPAEVTGQTYTHFGVGLSASGSGQLLLSGTITPNIVSGIGDVPILQTDSTITLS